VPFPLETSNDPRRRASGGGKAQRQKSITSINASKDERWLRGFRARMVPHGEHEIVAAIAERLVELGRAPRGTQLWGGLDRLTPYGGAYRTVHPPPKS
jgi:hypothetical protein